MEIYKVEILEPGAKNLLAELEKLSLIRMQKIEEPKKRERKFGSMKNLVVKIADDFNEPLEDFKEYM